MHRKFPKEIHFLGSKYGSYLKANYSNINNPETCGKTPLHSAVENGSLEVLIQRLVLKIFCF